MRVVRKLPVAEFEHDVVAGDGFECEIQCLRADMSGLVVGDSVLDGDHAGVRHGQHIVLVGQIRADVLFGPAKVHAILFALPVDGATAVEGDSAAQHHELPAMVRVVPGRAGFRTPGSAFERWPELE